jgi:hypothetical protein
MLALSLTDVNFNAHVGNINVGFIAVTYSFESIYNNGYDRTTIDNYAGKQLLIVTFFIVMLCVIIGMVIFFIVMPSVTFLCLLLLC